MTKIKILLSMLAIIPGILSAQHSLQSGLNMYRANDVLSKQQVSYKDPGKKGEYVLWDFSKLSTVNEAYSLDYSSGYEASVTGTENLTEYHYALQNDSLLLWGFENQTTQLHNIQPELLLKFPVRYGDTVKSYYYGHGKHGNRLEMDAMGTTETHVDAFGRMILPNKDTLKQVLRTHSIKYIAEKTQPVGDTYYDKLQHPLFISSDSIDSRLANDSVLFVVETFRWYEKGYRYPVFETVRSWEQHRDNPDYEFLSTAFFYPPQEHYYLDDDEANLALLNDTKEETTVGISTHTAGFSYNMYPNPVKTDLTVEMCLPKASTVRIQLRNMNGILEWDENKGLCPAGVCHFQFNMAVLPAGNYILNIWQDEQLTSDRIIKR